MEKILRRRVLYFGLQAACALAVLPAARTYASQKSEAAAAESCIDPAAESLRESLQYTDPAPDSEKPCGACAFFSAEPEEGKPSCGTCMIMSGPVNGTAWCESWSPKG